MFSSSHPLSQSWSCHTCTSPPSHTPTTISPPPPYLMSFHVSSPLRTTRAVRRELHSSTSPTFCLPETCTTPPRSDHDCQHHSLDLPSSSSCDLTSSMTLSHGSLDSISSRSDNKMLHSFRSIGLPSDYPLQRNSTGSTTITVEEELEDFEMFGGDDNISQRSQSSFPDRAATCDVRSMPPESPPDHRRNDAAPHLLWAVPSSKTVVKRPHHHRARYQQNSLDTRSVESPVSSRTLDDASSTSSLSSDVLLRIPPQRSHRPERNQAMGAKDFHDSVLKDLFDQISVSEFQD